MRTRPLVYPRVLTVMLALAGGLAAPTAARAEKDYGERTVSVPVHSSTYVRLGEPIARVSVGSSEVADVAAFPPDQLLITGKRIGQTTATVWARNDNVTVMTITVGYPTEEMTRMLREAIPDGKDLKVTTAGQSLLVTGEVPDVGAVERAEQIVRGFAASAATGTGEAPPVVNSVQVSGDHQVQLEVSFAEVSRSALREMGINLWAKDRNGNDFVTGLVAPTTSLQNLAPELSTDDALAGQLQNTNGLPVLGTPLSGAFGVVFATAAGSDFPFSAALSLLSNKGYARVLSEPTLVAMSGQEASFLAGGEFPIPLPQALGQVTVEYKKFGVQLKFVPTIVGDTIQLKLSTTVSDVDFSLGIRLTSVTVPGLVERHSATTVRLRDGQSFAIAGLLSDRVRSSVDKVPWLGDLPVLGALFRSTSYRREETELLVVVTAHIVRPQGEKPVLPGERTTTDPSDLELFFLGTHESLPTPSSAPRSKRRQPSGPVGFAR